MRVVRLEWFLLLVSAVRMGHEPASTLEHTAAPRHGARQIRPETFTARFTMKPTHQDENSAWLTQRDLGGFGYAFVADWR